MPESIFSCFLDSIQPKAIISTLTDPFNKTIYKPKNFLEILNFCTMFFMYTAPVPVTNRNNWEITVGSHICFLGYPTVYIEHPQAQLLVSELTTD